MVEARVYRQDLTQKHTRTHSQKEEKGKKIIDLAPKFPLFNLDSFLVYSGIPQMQGISS